MGQGYLAKIITGMQQVISRQDAYLIDLMAQVEELNEIGARNFLHLAFALPNSEFSQVVTAGMKRRLELFAKDDARIEKTTYDAERKLFTVYKKYEVQWSLSPQTGADYSSLKRTETEFD